jgi:hypothetical protein
MQECSDQHALIVSVWQPFAVISHGASKPSVNNLFCNESERLLASSAQDAIGIFLKRLKVNRAQALGGGKHSLICLNDVRLDAAR